MLVVKKNSLLFILYFGSKYTILISNIQKKPIKIGNIKKKD